jgi:hypothetical protein
LGSAARLRGEKRTDGLGCVASTVALHVSFPMVSIVVASHFPPLLQGQPGSAGRISGRSSRCWEPFYGPKNIHNNQNKIHKHLMNNGH